MATVPPGTPAFANVPLDMVDEMFSYLAFSTENVPALLASWQENGFSLDRVNSNGQTLFEYCMGWEFAGSPYDLVEALMEQPIDVTRMPPSGEPLLVLAFRYASAFGEEYALDLLGRLVDKGALVNAVGSNQKSVLDQALLEEPRLASFFHDRGATLSIGPVLLEDGSRGEGITALVDYVRDAVLWKVGSKNRIESVRCLLEWGADPATVRADGLSALAVARREGWVAEEGFLQSCLDRAHLQTRLAGGIAVGGALDDRPGVDAPKAPRL
jgi:hypothetical protein